MDKIWAYCRTSKPTQNVERQVRNILNKYPEAIVIKEAYTGTTFDRPQWNKLLKQIKPGQTIVFDSVSRMSRCSEEEAIETYKRLYKQGVKLVFLKEPQINTETYQSAINNCGIPMTGTSVDYILEGINSYLLALIEEQVKLAFKMSEQEVLDLRQRTVEGIETARLNGKRIGTPKGSHLITKKSIEAKKIIRKHSKAFGGNLSDIEVIKLAGIARGSFYKYKKELIEGN